MFEFVELAGRLDALDSTSYFWDAILGVRAMTHRERMLRTLRGEPTDSIPWAPRLDLWYNAQETRGTNPARFEGMVVEDFHR